MWSSDVDLQHRFLRLGEVHFQQGDTHARLYRVECGPLCHYMHSEYGRHEIIEFVFPGDIIGFGPLQTHVSTARAVTATEMSYVTANQFRCALENDGQLAARAAAAADWEFDRLRSRTVNTARKRSPAWRLASLLLVLSHLNATEVREPVVVHDMIQSGFVTERLGITDTQASQALDELQRLRLIAAEDAGLRIIDLDRLKRFADSAETG